MLLFGIFAVGIGIWRMFVTARSGVFNIWILGVLIVVVGWISAVIGGILILIAITDHASASLGPSGVSAACYRGAEDVCIVPIVIAPFDADHLNGK